MRRPLGKVAVLLLSVSLAYPGGASALAAAVPPATRLAVDHDWGPAGLEVRFRGLDPAVLARMADRKATREEWTSLCAVRAYFGLGEVPRDLPALIGSYEVRDDVLVFRPKYRLSKDGLTRLRCTLDRSLWGDPDRIPRGLVDPEFPSKVRIDVEFRPDPRPPSPAPVLEHVYPSAGVLPENLLRFYLLFSTPMSRGEAYKHIRLLDESGRPIPDPFLELDEELWSTDGKRFTLLFDPGRIKRGLKPREEVGPILEEGKSYTLVVEPGWSSALGVPLASPVRRTFRASPPDATSPDPATWKVQPPEVGTRDRLAVRFPEPLDHALARRLISVVDPEGRAVAGDVAIEEGERLWSLKPTKGPWEPGLYRLEIGTELEDLAGNSIARPFEVDLVEPISSRVRPQVVSLKFRIGTAPSPGR